MFKHLHLQYFPRRDILASGLSTVKDDSDKGRVSHLYQQTFPFDYLDKLLGRSEAKQHFCRARPCFRLKIIIRPLLAHYFKNFL